MCDNDVNTTKPDCPTTNANGVATLNGVSLSGINAGGPTGTGYAGALSASFAGDSGFSASNGSNSLTVNPKAATVTANDQTKTYGEDDPNFTFQTTGVLDGDTLTGVSCGVTGAHSDVAGSPYTITCSGNTNTNYDVTYNPGTLTVEQKQLTVTADNQSKTYDKKPIHRVHADDHRLRQR